MIVFFEKKRDGKGVVGFVNGKPAFVPYRSKIQPRPHTVWDCDMVEDRGRYVLIQPKKEIDLTTSKLEGDITVEHMWVRSERKLYITVRKGDEKITIPVPIKEITVDLDRETAEWVTKCTAVVNGKEISNEMRISADYRDDFRPADDDVEVDEKLVEEAAKVSARKYVRDAFENLRLRDYYGSISTDYRKIYPSAKIVDAKMEWDADERITVITLSDGTVLTSEEDEVAVEKLGDGITKEQALDLLFALNTIRSAVIISAMMDFEKEVWQSIAEMMGGKRENSAGAEFRSAIVSGKAFVGKTTDEIYEIADRLKEYVNESNREMRGGHKRTKIEQLYYDEIERELKKQRGAESQTEKTENKGRKKVVWFSRYEPLPAQIKALQKIYGEDVEIVPIGDRKFESENQMLEFFKEVGASGVVAILPLEKIQEMMNTEIGSKIDWLWGEYVDVKDGVRSEDEEGFDPERDYAGYFYNLGQHRRFVGFSRIKHYELQTEPLYIEDVNIEKPADAGNMYREIMDMVRKNKVKVVIHTHPNAVKIAVSYDKDTDMFQQLRPILKKMDYSFDPKTKEWFKIVEDRDVDEEMDALFSKVEGIGENIAERVALKHGHENNEGKKMFQKYNMMRTMFEWNAEKHREPIQLPEKDDGMEM